MDSSSIHNYIDRLLKTDKENIDLKEENRQLKEQVQDLKNKIGYLQRQLNLPSEPAIQPISPQEPVQITKRKLIDPELLKKSKRSTNLYHCPFEACPVVDTSSKIHQHIGPRFHKLNSNQKKLLIETLPSGQLQRFEEETRPQSTIESAPVTPEPSVTIAEPITEPTKFITEPNSEPITEPDYLDLSTDQEEETDIDSNRPQDIVSPDQDSTFERKNIPKLNTKPADPNTKLIVDSLKLYSNQSNFKSYWITGSVVDNYLQILIKNRPRHLAIDHFDVHRLQDKTKFMDVVTKAYDDIKIFSDYDVILLPFITNEHWTIVIVDNQELSIWHLDSRETSSPVPVQVTKNFLNQRRQWEAGQKPVPPKFYSVTVDTLPEENQQTNGVDCGIYLMIRARIHLAKGYFHYTQADMNKIRNVIKHEIITDTLVTL